MTNEQVKTISDMLYDFEEKLCAKLDAHNEVMVGLLKEFKK